MRASNRHAGAGPRLVNLLLRSALYYIGLIVLTMVAGPTLIILYPFPYRVRSRVVVYWAHCNLWWLATTCRLHFQVHGKQNIPETPTIVLSKHQSAWETISLNRFFHPQAWVLKRELLKIPFFGWGLAALNPIAIDRTAGATAVEQVVTQGRARLESRCWVVIFPEGTRVAPGVRRRYRMGGAILAAKTGYPVLPVAHNAGDYWPRNSFIKRPGTVQLEIGPLIDSRDKSAGEINAQVEQWIEATVARLREGQGATVARPEFESPPDEAA